MGSSGKYDAKFTKRQFMLELEDRLAAELRKRDGALVGHHERLRARHAWKRDLTGRPNGTIDPFYLCDLYSEMVAYAVNFTFPWCTFPSLLISFT